MKYVALLLITTQIYGGLNRPAKEKGQSIKPLETLSANELAGISLLRFGARLHLLVLNCRSMKPAEVRAAMARFSYKDFIDEQDVPRIEGVTDFPSTRRYAAPYDEKLYLQPGELMNVYEHECPAMHTAFWRRYHELEKQKELERQQEKQRSKANFLADIHEDTRHG